MDTDEADVARRRVLSPILDAEEYRTLSSSVRMQLGAASRPGKLRPFNQDHYLAVRLSRTQEVLETSPAASRNTRTRCSSPTASVKQEPAAWRVESR